MKNRLAYLLFSLICLCSAPWNAAWAQCTNQVLHTTGTALVGGVNVTVTTTGATDNYNGYCSAVTAPFFIGYNFGTGICATGSFTFTFSPAINGITLNYSGASCSGIACEEIRLTINGSHFAMPGVGTNNACDPLAVLTGAGDLQGCANCGVSGWSGTNITGFPISTLNVENFVMGGVPNGSLFSLWICNGILPAEWLDFEAQLQSNNDVALTWTTQSEINNDFFTVERSADGLAWEDIGQVDAGANPRQPQSYAFTDEAAHIGQNQYRIRQTSLDGTTNHGEVRTVAIEAGQGIHISPNPAHNLVQIEFADMDLAVVTLRNQLGQVVEVPQTVEADHITLHTTDLARGVYFVEVRTPERVHSQKLIVE